MARIRPDIEIIRGDTTSIDFTASGVDLTGAGATRATGATGATGATCPEGPPGGGHSPVV